MLEAANVQQWVESVSLNIILANWHKIGGYNPPDQLQKVFVVPADQLELLAQHIVNAGWHVGVQEG